MMRQILEEVGAALLFVALLAGLFFGLGSLNP
jgi:hypothetical protein